MIREDYLMRQIEIVARTLAKLIFNKDTAEYMIIDYQKLGDTDFLHERLVKLIAELKIDEAENLLFEKIEEELEADATSRGYLEVALDFYSRLNELSNQKLEDCGFEREEIDEGIREVSRLYGIDII